MFVAWRAAPPRSSCAVQCSSTGRRAALGGGLLSLLTSIVSARISPSGTASLTNTGDPAQ